MKYISAKLIAPCGMNCNLCSARLREEKHIVKCPGCRAADKEKPRSCVSCVIKNCAIIKKNDWKYCSPQCPQFPCRRLRNLDKRYRTKYGLSMIANLNTIADQGIRKFVAGEEKKWVKNGQVFCVHNKKYYGGKNN